MNFKKLIHLGFMFGMVLSSSVIRTETRIAFEKCSPSREKELLEIKKEKKRLEEAEGNSQYDKEKLAQEKAVLKQKEQKLIEIMAMLSFWALDLREIEASEQSENQESGFAGERSFLNARISLGLSLGEELFCKIYGSHNMQMQLLGEQADQMNLSEKERLEYFKQAINKKIEEIYNGTVTEVKMS
jgi:hypothetical protein